MNSRIERAPRGGVSTKGQRKGREDREAPRESCGRGKAASDLRIIYSPPSAPIPNPTPKALPVGESAGAYSQCGRTGAQRRGLFYD